MHAAAASAHVEIFTVQGLEAPSLCPYCVITALLSPCGSVMTDCSPGTDREVSHNTQSGNVRLRRGDSRGSEGQEVDAALENELDISNASPVVK